MDDPSGSQAYGMQAVGGCLIVHVTGGADEDGLIRLRKEILDRLAAGRFHGVLINVSAVSVLGSYGFSILRETARAVEMMGPAVVFVGFRPGVAAALVDFEVDFSGICSAVTTADAFEILGDSGDQDPVMDEEAGEPEENIASQDHETLL